MVPDRVIISVTDQKLMLVQDGVKRRHLSGFNFEVRIGRSWAAWRRRLDSCRSRRKSAITRLPGAVFHNRRFTGEILPPNAPGRDPIITRIIWLRGLSVRIPTLLVAAFIFTVHRRKNNRPARELRLHPDEIERCDRAL